MSDWIDIIRLFVLSVLIPVVVFVGNFLWRHREGYLQTAAADFILCILIFDIAAVVASKEVAPFMRSAELVPLITYWHFSVGCLSALVWLAILRWGEPILAAHYHPRANVGRPRFPLLPVTICWLSIFFLVAIHIGFFAAKLAGADHV